MATEELIKQKIMLFNAVYRVVYDIVYRIVYRMSSTRRRSGGCDTYQERGLSPFLATA